MAGDFQALVERVSVQLEGLERREHERERKIEEHGKEIVAIKTALGLEGKFGERIHEEIRERLKEGDGDLRELRKKSQEHSGELRGIRQALEKAQAAAALSSGRRWDLAQILITAAIGIICALISAGVSSSLSKAVPPAPAATKGGAP